MTFPENCETCKILLDEAAAAIAAHAQAVADLARAVNMNAENSLASYEERVRATCEARENTVFQYESHRSRHGQKVMTAGATSFDPAGS